MSQFKYSVDYHRINGGVGDCEIVLFINSQSTPPKIDKAVLSDGGEPIAQYLTNVKKAFIDIEDTYKTKQLQFDAIIIPGPSNDDHYRGIFELMSRDVDLSTRQVPWLTPNSILSIPHQFQQLPNRYTFKNDGNDTFLYLGADESDENVASFNICKVVRDDSSLPHKRESLASGHPQLVDRERPNSLDRLIDPNTLPSFIPNKVMQIIFQLDGSSIDSFSGTPSANYAPAAPGAGDVPVISFDSLKLDAFYSWGSSPSWGLSIAVTVNLNLGDDGMPLKSTENDSGVLRGYVDYDSSTKQWALTGSLSNITFTGLRLFFEDEYDQIQDVLASIKINSMTLTYIYSKGMPSEFNFDGAITLGGFDLGMTFRRKEKQWTMDADLTHKPDEGDTLTNVLGSISDSLKDDLPDFFDEIHLIPDKMSLKCVKNVDLSLLFILQVAYQYEKIGSMSFTFVQMSYPSSGGNLKPKPLTRRLLSFAFTDVLPSFKISAPIFGTLENPIDGLELLWVDKGPDSTHPIGLTRKQVVDIQSSAQSSGKPMTIYFKETKVPGHEKSAPGDSDVVVGPGCHFMLLVKSGGTPQVALDYSFMAGRKKPPSGQFAVSAAVDPSTPTQSKTAVNKTIGPLSVSNIGLQYEKGMLSVLLDASLSLGPISLAVLGFKIGVNVADLFKDLTSLHLGVDFSGLAAGLDKPPLILAGLFTKFTTSGGVIYSGGVVVSIKPYGVLAFGSYGSFKDFDTLFIFGQLEGPLVELGFATIDGVKLGFGYNSYLKYPTIDDVSGFPLIQGIDSNVSGKVKESYSAFDVLTTDGFSKWIQPRNHSLWFAAGLRLQAFKALDIDAVAVIELDPDISLGLFAKAVFSFPPKSSTTFVFVEVGITCRLIFKEGFLAVEASICPSSYVLLPECRLTGGLALYYWFDPSPHAGDFVFTIGGYHASFTPPAYYPKPQRLGISFRLNDNIHVEGNAYFAITPKVCMGGGRIEINFSAGPAYAYFTAYADFFIVYKPFYFTADMGVHVGAGLRGKILCFDADISVHVGADLHLEGPPFSGWVEIDLYVKVLHVDFGGHRKRPDPLTFAEFQELVMSAPNSASFSNASKNPGITLAIESGSAPGKEAQVSGDSSDQSWTVDASNFSFVVQCCFALQTISFGGKKVIPETEPYKVNARPMQQSLASTTEITIKLKNVEQHQFTFKPIMKKAPTALWKEYSKDEDPLESGSLTSSFLRSGNDPTIEALMGAHVIGPKPTMSDDGIPAYKIIDGMLLDIMLEDPKLPNRVQPSLEEHVVDYDKVKDIWLKTQKDVVQGFTNEWTNAFGWKTRLNGMQPEYLLKKFNEFYLYAPKSTSPA